MKYIKLYNKIMKLLVNTVLYGSFKYCIVLDDGSKIKTNRYSKAKKLMRNGNALKCYTFNDLRGNYLRGLYED